MTKTRIRVKYIKDKRKFLEWFLDEETARETMQSYGVTKYALRMIEFPFDCTRDSVHGDSSLHWLNQWATGPVNGIRL
jgi:hypothetical protein